MHVKSIAFHRNGVSGASFHLVRFTDEKGAELIASVFSSPGHVAVHDVHLAANDEIRFKYNSWRGDWYERRLRAAIKNWDEDQDDNISSIQ